MRVTNSIVKWIDPERSGDEACNLGVLAVLKKIKPGGFKLEPKEEKMKTFYQNLLGQFGLTEGVLKRYEKYRSNRSDGGGGYLGLSIRNLGWTEKAKEDFYNWGWHKKFYGKHIKKDWMWVLNCEPVDMDKIERIAVG